ncbi:N-acetylglucosamine MFS transporter NagP [Cellvibrio sp. NN19]|uniref:N-acetylglucosamine MFS transporter NagP n=1 Tax=Cellvibrio chitinivorans TaxID=3102792 RepID=UPI002B40CB88|nr:MFS transporter [Cellvibrio sp. NN19]
MDTPSQATPTVVSASPGGNFLPLALVAGLFFILGFVTWLNGSLMPYLEEVLTLTPLDASLILFAFYVSSTLVAIPSVSLIAKVGYKNSMALGLVGMAVAALTFIPAAMAHTFALFLFAQFLMGASLTLLQTAVNPYVVKIGPEESAAVRISVMGMLNKSAGIVAPMMFTALILSGMSHTGTTPTEEEKRAMADSLIFPYMGMALCILAVALIVKLSSLPELNLDAEDAGEVRDSGFHFKESLAHPNLVLGVFALILYVGVEVIAADTIGSYGRSIGYENYTSLTSFTMTFMLIGYGLGISFIPRLISQASALLVSAVLGCLLSVAIVLGDNQSTAIANVILVPFGLPALPDTLVFIAMMGLANAIVWPAVWPMALSGLGRLTGTGSALLVMAIAGGGVLPVLLNSLGAHEEVGRQTAYIITLPAYLFILFYAAKGHKIKRWKK